CFTKIEIPGPRPVPARSAPLLRLHRIDHRVLVIQAAANRDGSRSGHTPPIHLRSSHTAFSEVTLRPSKIFFAAEITLPRFRLLNASLALIATNCSTLGSR